MKAFVLCKMTPGLEQDALRQIRDIEGVTEVYLVFGGWDAVLEVEADTMDKLSGLIVAKIRMTKGVSGSETLVTASF